MTTRKQREWLIAPDDVDSIFDTEAIARLANLARVSDEKAHAFGIGVRQSVIEYLKDAQRLQAGEVRDEIAGLGKAISKALEGSAGDAEPIAEILSKLSTQAREILEKNSSRTGDKLITSEEILDPDQAGERLKHLWGICVSGAKVVPGRFRDGGSKQSRPTLEIEHASPPVRAVRPKNTSEFFLCASIGGHYANAKGKIPFRGQKEENRGPFEALIKEILSLVGARGVYADRLVRQYQERLSENK